jgi:hypothetical protein
MPSPLMQAASFDIVRASSPVGPRQAAGGGSIIEKAIDMRMTVAHILLGTGATLALAAIVLFFGLSFVYPDRGPVFLIGAAGALVSLGAFFVIVHFLERRSEAVQFALVNLHRYLSFSIRILLVIATIIALVASFAFFIVVADSHYFINCGCYIAFLMIIILIELFIRILLPLGGVDQHL